MKYEIRIKIIVEQNKYGFDVEIPHFPGIINGSDTEWGAIRNALSMLEGFIKSAIINKKDYPHLFKKANEIKEEKCEK